VVRREPSAWGLLSEPLKPSSHAGFGLALPNPPPTQRQTPQTCFISHAGSPPCRSRRQFSSPVRSPYRRASQFLAASFARSRCFRDLLRFRAFGGCASGERDGDHSKSSCR
jgi:hypothetical protein